MKKIALVATVATLSTAALSTTAMAADLQGLYVQGDIGVSKLEAKDEGKLKDNNTGVRIAAGMDTGALRYQADYSHFGKIKGAGEEGDYEFKTQSLGGSVIYDFDTQSAFTPYAGVRVGVNRLKVSADNHVDGFYSASKTQVGAGVLAGVQYQFTPALAVNAGVEYNHLGKIDSIKVNQYGATIGLRYSF